MTKNRGLKLRKLKTYTYEKYQEEFFPVSSDKKIMQTDKPYSLGVSLARESLMKHIILLCNRK